MQELRKIETIRLITQDCYKDLGKLIDARKGQIPIFGYPQVCYSPNNQEQEYKPIYADIGPASRTQGKLYDEKTDSYWILMMQSIQASTKEGHQLLIKDLLDSYDENKEKIAMVYKLFTRGQSPGKTNMEGFQISKRAIKARPDSGDKKKKDAKKIGILQQSGLKKLLNTSKKKQMIKGRTKLSDAPMRSNTDFRYSDADSSVAVSCDDSPKIRSLKSGQVDIRINKKDLQADAMKKIAEEIEIDEFSPDIKITHMEDYASIESQQKEEPNVKTRKLSKSSTLNE